MHNDPPYVSFQDFQRVSRILYRKAGLLYPENKLYYLAGRIQKRMLLLGVSGTAEYIQILERTGSGEGELQELVNIVTVNETYFFRDFPQLESFSSGCLREVVLHKNSSADRTINVWSAGCSSGEEAYTIAIILKEMLSESSNWDIRILASDIDKAVLTRAKKGEYDSRSLRDLPAEYLTRYFRPTETGTHRVRDEIRALVQFEHLNLMDDQAMRKRTAFDFIFCRNVLIYFDDTSRRKVVDHFYVALNRPGFIFLGSSEVMGRITSAFTVKRLSNALVYGKE